jgi:hypothetical protein
MKDLLIHQKLDELQFQGSIAANRFLIVKINEVGFGAQIQLKLIGFKLAYIFKRTVVFDEAKSCYDNCFLPTSIFSWSDFAATNPIKLDLDIKKQQSDRVVYLDFAEYWDNFKTRKKFEEYTPQELTKEGKSYQYFLGQLLLRLQPLPKYKEYIEERKKRINFSHPIIGVHIRRGDKKIETAYVPIRLYAAYIKNLVKKTGIKKVFVASDSNEVIQQLPAIPQLEYIYDYEEKRYNNSNYSLVENNPNLREQETLTAWKNIALLSECDYLIGQTNTNFTKLATYLKIGHAGNSQTIFINRNWYDIYFSNEPNPLSYIADIVKKVGVEITKKIGHHLRPILKNSLYDKIKKTYYRN